MRRYECDRCGKICEDIEIKTVTIEGMLSTKTIDLCPECEKIYKSMLKKFMKECKRGKKK